MQQDDMPDYPLHGQDDMGHYPPYGQAGEAYSQDLDGLQEVYYEEEHNNGIQFEQNPYHVTSNAPHEDESTFFTDPERRFASNEETAVTYGDETIQAVVTQVV